MISSGRLAVLQSTLAAWNKTGFPFLRLDNGIITPLENNYGGDAELFYFVPYLARVCGISIEQALWWWDTAFASLGVLVALGGFWFLATTKLQKVIAFIGVAGVGCVAWNLGDTYIAPFVAVSCIPWIFVLLQNQQFKALLWYSFFSGLIIGLTNSIRIFGGYSLGIVLISATALYTKKCKKTILVSVALVLGVANYNEWFSSVMTARNKYLAVQFIPYGEYALKHVFWHSVYVGCGFITNDYGIYYGDSCALLKARETDPNTKYCSAEYDEILRNETLKLCLYHPHHLLRVLFAKAGVLFYYLLLFSNVGLLCAWVYRKPWYLEIPYALALMFNALPGFAAIPVAMYLIGFFAIATFYGIHSIIWALQQDLLSDLRRLFRKIFF